MSFMFSHVKNTPKHLTIRVNAETRLNSGDSDSGFKARAGSVVTHPFLISSFWGGSCPTRRFPNEQVMRVLDSNSTPEANKKFS